MERFFGRLFRKKVGRKPTNSVSHVAFVTDQQLSDILSSVPKGTCKVMGKVQRNEDGRLTLVSIDPSTAKQDS